MRVCPSLLIGITVAKNEINLIFLLFNFMILFTIKYIFASPTKLLHFINLINYINNINIINLIFKLFIIKFIINYKTNIT
jgi:hypothetical protein